MRCAAPPPQSVVETAPGQACSPTNPEATLAMAAGRARSRPLLPGKCPQPTLPTTASRPARAWARRSMRRGPRRGLGNQPRGPPRPAGGVCPPAC
eukprot:scaffold1253_cov430-Prasinococcus_capsulatus_cf.AAC.3